MRERPRTCPSIRLSRLRHGALISVRMIGIYPAGVYSARPGEATKVRAMSNPVPATKTHHAAHVGDTRPAEKSQAPVSEGTIYTCPMHPEIRQVGPGNCPICGMTLEP